MKTVKTMMNAVPINIFKVQIDIDINFLRKAIANFECENDELTPYLIMNEKTLNELNYLAHVRKGNYVNNFEGCKIVIDCTLEDGQVLLR